MRVRVRVLRVPIKKYLNGKLVQKNKGDMPKTERVQRHQKTRQKKSKARLGKTRQRKVRGTDSKQTLLTTDSQSVFAAFAFPKPTAEGKVWHQHCVFDHGACFEVTSAKGTETKTEKDR